MNTTTDIVTNTPALDQTAAPWDESAVRALASELKDLDGPLLPILHALSERFGFVDPRAIPVVADVLNLSRAEVHGVVSFYHDFRTTPPGRHTVKLCAAEACQAMGAERLATEIEAATSGDAAFTVEPVYCLGNCALAPSALIDGELLGRLDAAAVLARLGK